MVEANPRILQSVRKLIAEVLGPHHIPVYLFGSWAQGKPGVASDIDVAVDPSTPLPAGTLAKLRERLEESHIPYRVEVVDLSQTDHSFRAQILRSGIPWNG